MGMEEFSVSMTNRSIRTIKAELEFLAENSAITRQQLSTILSELPEETSFGQTTSIATTNGISNRQTNSNTPALPQRNNTPSIKNEKSSYYNEPADSHTNPPPSYASTAPPPPPAATALTHAVALYAYPATDAGDLALQMNDRIAVTEYMNAEWWKGKNERTGQEGIFPRSYVRLEEKSAPAPSSYGNVLMDVSQGTQQPEGEKKKGTAQKIGGKLGNAAIFGAGATIGSNIVNSIF